MSMDCREAEGIGKAYLDSLGIDYIAARSLELLDGRWRMPVNTVGHPVCWIYIDRITGETSHCNSIETLKKLSI